MRPGPMHRRPGPMHGGWIFAILLACTWLPGAPASTAAAAGPAPPADTGAAASTAAPVAATVPQSGSGAKPDPDVAARLLAAARLEPQIAQFARNIGRGWTTGLNNPGLPPQARARAERLMNEVSAEYLTGSRLTADVSMALARLRPADAAAALAWWSSPLGTRIASLDATAESPELQVAMARFVGDLQVKPLPPERVQRMTDLVTAVGVGAFMRDITTRTMEGMLAAIRAGAPAGAAAPSTDELQEQLKGALDVLAVRAEQAVRLQLLYQYRDVGDADLDRYVEFARSDAGRAYSTALYGALGAGVARAAEVLGQRLFARDEDASRT